VDAALGDQAAIARHHRAQVERGVERHLEAAQAAVVDPEQRRGHRQRALELVEVVHFHQHVHAERERQVRELASAASPSAATMSSTQSAPSRRDSYTCQASTRKSFRSTGSVQAARACCR
jgi:hypothetical protein